MAHAPPGDILLLASLTMFGSVALDMYLPALPRIARALAVSPAEAQATISIFLAGVALGQLVYGPLSDRVGRRPPILIGVAIFLAASAACALAHTLQAMILARLAQAIGACAGMVAARAVVRDRYEDHEVLYIFSLLSLVFGIAPILAPLVGGWVMSSAGWRWIFGVQAVFGLVVGTCAFRYLPETRSEATRLRARSERPLASYLQLLRQPRLVGCLLTGALGGAALFAYITCAPEVVITYFHVPATRFGWVFGLNAAGLIGANQANAWLARRVAGDRLMTYALYGGVTSAVVLAISAVTGLGGMWGVLASLFAVVSSLGFTQPNATAAAMSVDRHRAGSTAALLGASLFGVGGLSGVATGLLHDGTAKPMAIVILGALALALAAQQTLVVQRRPHRQVA